MICIKKNKMQVLSIVKADNSPSGDSSLEKTMVTNTSQKFCEKEF